MGGSLFSSSPNYDSVIDTEAIKHGYENRSNLTVVERLDLMWRRDENGNISPELQECLTTTVFAGISCFLIGGMRHSRKAYDDFMIENKHQMFRHPREAQMAVFERTQLAMFKGGGRLGIRAFIMTSMFMIGINTANVVRNDINPLDHAGVGFITGAIYRVLGGPRAMLGSGFVGSCFGLLEGSLTWVLSRVSGETVEARWRRKFEYLENTNSEFLKNRQSEAEKQIPRPKWRGDGFESNTRPEFKADPEDGEEPEPRTVITALFLRFKHLVFGTNIFDD